MLQGGKGKKDSFREVKIRMKRAAPVRSGTVQLSEATWMKSWMLEKLCRRCFQHHCASEVKDVSGQFTSMLEAFGREKPICVIQTPDRFFPEKNN